MSEKNYSAVPPPPSLASSETPSVPVNFNDALSKARAIAEKLKQQSAASSPPTNTYTSTGTKRGYSDESSPPSSVRSYGSYQDGRDSKRSAYDGGSSRPSYDTGKESRRYGLGSEERKPSYNSQKQEEYSVPNHLVGLLIGKGGENLKKIERMSGVSKVQFATDPVGNERPVHLYGESDQIAVARDMIRQMVADAQSNEANRYGGRNNDYQAQQSGPSISISIPASKVGLVIGRGGETIRDFEERSKAKIVIASDNNRDNERVITLAGPESATQLAKSLIEDIVYGNNNMGGSRNWDNNSQQSNSYGGRMGRADGERSFINIPVSIVGLIIGRGGETIRTIQDQSGARVKVDNPSDPNSTERTVVISGDSKAVAIAKQLVEDKIAEADRGRHGSRGYKSQQQDYDESGYDYQQQQQQQQQHQQYNQYYGQYYNDNSSYQQYSGYNDMPSGNDPNDDKTNNSNDQSNFDYAAYYTQYYNNGQQLTPEQQEAYYKWYQQYYGQYQAGSDNVDGEPVSSTSEEKPSNDK